MELRRLLSMVGILAFSVIGGLAQYPQYFQYDDESGLPSNKVYSILEDRNGFIWLGCDAGLFKFDGIRYIPFSCTTRKTNSITGLTLSESGKIYGYNFRSQLFCVQSDSLRELPHPYEGIYGLTADNMGNLLITHGGGISCYDEQSRAWTDYSGFTQDRFAYFASKNPVDGTKFFTSKGVGTLSKGKIRMDSVGNFQPVGTFLIENHHDQHFVFSNYRDQGYRIHDGKLHDLGDSRLYSHLRNRKVTNALTMPDDYLWITTYSGIIRYDPAIDSATLYYPNLAFSDCLIDREGNYWFSTLHSGLLRVAALDFRVWNKGNPQIPNKNITGVTTDGSSIYFAAAEGTVGKLDPGSGEVSTFHTGKNADVQSLDFVSEENRLYFNINDLYSLQGNALHQEKSNQKSIKSIRKINDDYFVLTSFGAYVEADTTYKLCEQWARELLHDRSRNTVWIATNQGVVQCIFRDGRWIVEKTMLPETQALSLTANPATQELYVLAFDARIYSIAQGKPKLLTSLPGSALATAIRCHGKTLYVATNQGLWMFDLNTNAWSRLDKLDGLASDDVHGICIQGKNLWLATSNGLQMVPIRPPRVKPRARIFLKHAKTEYALNYGQTLVLQPEAAHYGSNGKYSFAYRTHISEWIVLPGSVTEIQIPNLPSGKFAIEIKAIDQWGRDSENTIRVAGFVRPPFWQKWWFIAGVILVIALLVSLLVRRYVDGIRRRENQKTQLITSQLTALKSQMHPHFIFNVLNSIKSYIYENDKEKAINYLDDFADLVRRTLEMSETQYHDIAEEFKLLKLYIELEAMMLSGGFSCSIEDDGVLESHLKIPTMILQPIIENAFKHGLRNKAGEKKLTISLRRRSDSEIQVSITDNGIGREASLALNAANGNRKTSFATGAIEKRLALIHSQGLQTISAETVDLRDAEGRATGTQVLLTLKNIHPHESDHH